MDDPIPKQHFADALISAAPSGTIPPEQRIFAPFIGAWRLAISWIDLEGRVEREEPGEWHFSWVLDGCAVQDVWIWPPRAEREGRPGVGEYGTSLRFYDADLGAWQSIWVGPAHRYVRRFTARGAAGEVTLQTQPDEKPAMRWTFHDVQADSFNWRNEVYEDGRWRVQQRFVARRV